MSTLIVKQSVYTVLFCDTYRLTAKYYYIIKNTKVIILLFVAVPFTAGFKKLFNILVCCCSFDNKSL